MTIGNVTSLFDDDVVGKMRKRLNSVRFAKANHLLLSKSYEKTSGELTLKPWSNGPASSRKWTQVELA